MTITVRQKFTELTQDWEFLAFPLTQAREQTPGAALRYN